LLPIALITTGRLLHWLLLSQLTPQGQESLEELEAAMGSALGHCAPLASFHTPSTSLQAGCRAAGVTFCGFCVSSSARRLAKSQRLRRRFQPEQHDGLKRRVLQATFLV